MTAMTDAPAPEQQPDEQPEEQLEKPRAHKERPAQKRAHHGPNERPHKRPPNPVLERLNAEFAVFRDGKPLAVGIHRAIRERLSDLGYHPLSQALKLHVGSTRYLKAIAVGEDRFDLDGNPVSKITEEQRQQAALTLRERFQKTHTRHKVEREAEHTAQVRQEKLDRLMAKFKKD